jgi:hypothetical protein
MLLGLVFRVLESGRNLVWLPELVIKLDLVRIPLLVTKVVEN